MACMAWQLGPSPALPCTESLLPPPSCLPSRSVTQVALRWTLCSTRSLLSLTRAAPPACSCTTCRSQGTASSSSTPPLPSLATPASSAPPIPRSSAPRWTCPTCQVRAGQAGRQAGRQAGWLERWRALLGRPAGGLHAGVRLGCWLSDCDVAPVACLVAGHICLLDSIRCYSIPHFLCPLPSVSQYLASPGSPCF